MRHKPIPGPAKPASPQPTGALHFNIGRITLDGYSGAEQRRFQSSLETHLARLGRNASGRTAKELTLKHLDAGEPPPGATPEATARHIAARIVAALGRSGARDA